MHRAFHRISVAASAIVGFFAVAVSPALADGDPYYSNGINPSGVRTPVPAPIPIPVEEAEWYFRGDFAAGFGGSPSVNVMGTNLVDSIFGSGRYSQSFEPSFTGGAGVGYVWSPRWRTDFTAEVHSIMHAEETNAGVVSVDGAPAAYTVAQDKTKYISTILLFNGYYDFRTGSPWTPYLGAGLGFAVNQLTQISTLGSGGTESTLSERSTTTTFAAAAMAGVTYDVSSFFAIDVNYRFLHIGGSDVTLSDMSIPLYTVGVGDLNEHQIRAGMRFYVN
jgi:opacity protein-like surface antigen